MNPCASSNQSRAVAEGFCLHAAPFFVPLPPSFRLFDVSKIFEVRNSYLKNFQCRESAACEHEMDGKAKGGVGIESADTSDGSFRGEIGATMKPDNYKLTGKSCVV